MKAILFALILALPLAIGPAQGGSASVTLTLDAKSYSAADTLTGSPPVATVGVHDAQGVASAGVDVRIVFIRQVPFVGYVSNETFTGVTGADGTFSVPAGTMSSLPGNYFVVAFAAGDSTARGYTIGV